MDTPPSSSPPSGDLGYTGSQQLASGAGRFNAHDFQIMRWLQKTWVSTLVQVVAVTPYSDDGTTGGTVDLQPLVNQVDGNGNAVPHGVLYGVQYWRLQGGANAVIVDPVAMDIGLAIFADRDISRVKATRKQGNPGSSRFHDPADGVYLGGLLNGQATQFIRMAQEGIRLKSPVKIFLDAPATEVTGDLIVDGKLTSTGDSSLAGGAKAVVLDGDPVSGGVVHATSTKTKAT